MRRWWLIGLLALALSVTACGKDEDSKEAVVAKKPHKKRKKRRKRKKKRLAKKAGDKGKAGDKAKADDTPGKTGGDKEKVADAPKVKAGAGKAPGKIAPAAETEAAAKAVAPPRPGDAPDKAAVEADAAKALREARAAHDKATEAEAAKAARVAEAATEPPVPAAKTAPAAPAPVAAEAGAGAAKTAAAKAAEAANAASKAAEQEAAARQAAAQRGRVPPPTLDITGYLSSGDLERVFKKKWKFELEDLAGIKPDKGYNALYFTQGKRRKFGVSVQVWRDLNLIDSRTRFNTMKNTYTDVVATKKVAEQGFRAYYGGIVTLVFVDPRRPLLAAVSCSTRICNADALIELSRRVKERLR
ncbi:MAG: hypothetical protein KC502_03885 [Myxococcales bacterium]|nr:hypothetical protein [Myxococcales bacterium]